MHVFTAYIVALLVQLNYTDNVRYFPRRLEVANCDKTKNIATIICQRNINGTIEFSDMIDLSEINIAIAMFFFSF